MQSDSIGLAACVSCVRFRGSVFGPDGPNWICDAFRDAPIPVDITSGLNRHTTDVPGDHGLHYEKKVQPNGG